MKKKFLFGLSALFTMFVGILCVSAATVSVPTGGKLEDMEKAGYCTKPDDKHAICIIPFVNNEGQNIEISDAIKIEIESQGGASNVNVTAESGFTIVESGQFPLGANSKTSFKIKKDDGVYAVGNNYAFKVEYELSDNPGDPCFVGYKMVQGECSIKRNCSSSQDGDGNCYYDRSGSFVKKEEFDKDCYECVSKEKAYDGQYHGLNGFVDDEATYRDECEHYCKIDEDKETGAKIYYNKKGVIVTKEEYDKDCNPKTGEIANPYVLAGIGAILIGGIAVVTIKQNKLKRI